MVADSSSVTAEARSALPYPILLLIFLLFAQSIHALTTDTAPGSISARWSALLHIHDSRALITDQNFLLAESDKIEQLSDAAGIAALRQQTLRLFNAEPSAKCRFPARYITLVNEGALKDSGLTECAGYQEFIRRVPVEEISIVFASEHLTQPSSIMGHVMLAMSGENTDGLRVDHSASFFTTLDFKNPANFIAQTLISGKEGYFIVQPLSESLNNYLYTEQRNVWRYPLILTDEQRTLLQAHMWELGSADIPYLFQSHNCATLSLDLIRLAIGDAAARRDWVSPIDVVRYADERALFSEKQVLASDRWKISMLQEFMTRDDADRAAAWVRGESSVDGDALGPVSQKLGATLARYRVTRGEISPLQYEALMSESSGWQSTTLELTDYRDPLKSAADAHLSLGWQRDGDSDWLTFNWLPAAHDLLDNNRNYFGESTLRLSEVSIRASVETGHVQLNRWTLYETLALNPIDRLTGGVSGYFHLRFDRDPVDSLESEPGITTEGGLGVSAKLARDIGAFALLGAGLRADSDGAVVFLHPQAGMWIYEVGGMKSWIRAGIKPATSAHHSTYVGFDHSIEIKKSGLLVLTAERKMLDQDYRDLINFNYRHYF